MREQEKSVIEDFIENFDMPVANRRLLAHVENARKEAGITYHDLAEVTGYSERRLKYLLSEARNPTLYREEVQVLALATGIGLDQAFGLPDLSAEDEVEREYQTREKAGEVLSVIDMVGDGSQHQQFNRTDFMRSCLYLNCLSSILHKYEDREAA